MKLEAEYLGALAQNLDSVASCGTYMNLHKGRGLVFFLIDPVTKSYETSFLRRVDLTEENLVVEGFAPEVVSGLVKHADAYVHGKEYAAVAGSRANGAVREFSLLVAHLTVPKHFSSLVVSLN